MLRLSSRFGHGFALLLPLVILACSDDEGASSSGGGGGGTSTGTESSTGSGTQSTSATGPTTSGTSAGGNTGSSGAGGEAGSGGAGTGGGAGPSPVLLGDAGNYVVLAKSAITNVPTSDVTGDLGLSPAAASYIEGFSMTRVGTHWTSAQVTGSIFAADNDPPTPTALTTAVGAMEAAYTDAATRPTPDFLDIGEGGAIGGLTLAPGLYRWNSTVTIADDVTITGAADDVWIFQVTGDLSMSSARRMTLAGGAEARNIVWQVAGEVVFQASSHAEGVVLGQTAITLQTGASIRGRLLAQTAVNLAGSTIVGP